MNHTYDSLRELSVAVVTFASTDAQDSLLVLIDALQEAGVMLPFHDGSRLYTSDDRKRATDWARGWAIGWAMKAVYGASRVKANPFDAPSLEPTTEQDVTHRRWSEERIALRRLGVKFRGTMKRAEINAALGRA